MTTGVTFNNPRLGTATAVAVFGAMPGERFIVRMKAGHLVEDFKPNGVPIYIGSADVGDDPIPNYMIIDVPGSFSVEPDGVMSCGVMITMTEGLTA